MKDNLDDFRFIFSSEETEEDKKRSRDCEISLRKLGDAFADLAEGTVTIPQGNTQDIVNFLKEYERLKYLTKKHNIHFG